MVNKGLILFFLVFAALALNAQNWPILKADKFAHYVEYFNNVDDEPIQNAIPNSACWDWMQENIPLFECPDEEIEQIYYYRWWVYRKHIKETPAGYVITEFLPEVRHAGRYNTIACASGLHIDEGKWLRNPKYVSDYLKFWFSDEGEPRQYSSWLASAVYDFCIHTGNFTLAEALLPKLVNNYLKWEENNLHESGLFWSHDDRDGGEYSISGSGLRPTLNSYMYADAHSISKMADHLENTQVSEEFKSKADKLKMLVQERIWDKSDEFFCCIPLENKTDVLQTFNHREVDPDRHVRELYGYFPWRFMLPDEGYESAWEQILDTGGFAAPYGPTTAEQRHPLYMKNRIKRCQWDGSSWPFATSLALGGMRNLLHYYNQDVIGKKDFLNAMKIYAHSQHRTLPYGEVIPWIGESLHPQSGLWLSRAIALDMDIPIVAKQSFKDKNAAVVRGKDYNHSSYCDLVISGLVGLVIGEDGTVTVDPLIPVNEWDWFCLDGLVYKDKTLSIVYDKSGEKYEVKSGLSVLVDGERVAHSKKLKRLVVMIN